MHAATRTSLECRQRTSVHVRQTVNLDCSVKCEEDAFDVVPYYTECTRDNLHDHAFTENDQAGRRDRNHKKAT